MKKYYFPLVLISVAFVYSFTYNQPKPWVVPDKYAKMANPVESDAECLKTAKSLWAKHCQSCHGKTGKGDGTKAGQLDTPMEDFTSGEVQKQTDGALFFKTLEGRDEMPSFKKKIPDEEEIWTLINFIRTLKA